MTKTLKLGTATRTIDIGKVSLTDLERTVLELLFASSRGNGHDFGFIEDARRAVPQRNQLAGVVASLVKKRVINVYDPVRGESGMWTQFDFCALKDGEIEDRAAFDVAEAELKALIEGEG